MKVQIDISEADAGKRLDLAIAESGQGISRSQAKNLISAERVRIDGAVVTKASLLTSVGQQIDIEIPNPTKLDLTPQEVGIRILFEDEHLAVLDKPAGISVHPSTTETGATVVHGLLHALKSLSTVGGVERPGIVHRIDKGTSGILVVSKTDAAHLGLSRQFKAHTIDRRYSALVYGDVRAKLNRSSGTIDTFFGRNPKHRKKMTGKLTEGRKAVTHWKVIASFPKAAITQVECRLETGRTHQIRVHLSEMGFGIVGDPLYGDHEKKARALSSKQPELGKACLALSHQLLHAYRLGFEHPITQKHFEFESPPPSDFASILETLRPLENKNGKS
jgi:23S rRNA pseudouridine1911/1915/1917 synthase